MQTGRRPATLPQSAPVLARAFVAPWALDEVIAVVDPENARSQRVAEKAGLQACGEAMSRALGPEVVRHDQPMR